MFGHATAAVEMAADAGNAAGGGRLRYAGFWARVAALIVDNAIITLFCLVSIAGAASAGDAAVLVAMAVCLLTALLYWPLLECSARQATFGKQLLGVQVTDMEGGRLAFARSLLRNLAKIVSSLLLGTGFLLAGLTVRKQALHDTIVGCLVVRTGPAHRFRAVALSIAGLIVIFGGCYYLAAAAYIPQALAHLAKQMHGTGDLLQKGLDKALNGAQSGAPAPAPQPAAAAPPVPSAAPQPGAATPPIPSPAAVEAVVVVAPETPPIAASAPAAASKPAAAPMPRVAVPVPPAVASAPVKPATAPAAPATAPAVAVKPSPAKPAAKARVAAPAKPVAPAAEQMTAPVLFAESVSEPPRYQPQPARRATVPRLAAESATPVPAAPPRMVITPKYNDVMTAVMYRDAAAITQLLDLGWWVDRPDTNGVSPLMAAAWNGDLALVQLLLERGANPNLRARGGSVLDYAGRSGDATVIELVKRAGAR